jgi:hypothetical protein
MANCAKNQPLLSEQQRKELAVLVTQALVFIRSLGERGDAKQAANLANAVHRLPVHIADAKKFDWNRARSDLAEYEKKYPESRYHGLVMMLDRIRALGTWAKA